MQRSVLFTKAATDPTCALNYKTHEQEGSWRLINAVATSLNNHQSSICLALLALASSLLSWRHISFTGDFKVTDSWIWSEDIHRRKMTAFSYPANSFGLQNSCLLLGWNKPIHPQEQALGRVFTVKISLWVEIAKNSSSGHPCYHLKTHRRAGARTWGKAGKGQLKSCSPTAAVTELPDNLRL